MKKTTFLLILTFSLVTSAVEVPSTPRDSNTKNTGGYDGTRVQTQFVVSVKDETNVLHFIRDNNDPRVITKTYITKNVDIYEFRDYLRQMVQAKRVGNTSMQQQQPGNAAGPVASQVTATVSQPVLTTPPNTQPGYNPPLELGSNTAVECLKFADGTGLLMVSAEEYRFKSNENGMGIDALVSFFDRPEYTNFGSQVFFYLPKYVPAMNLQNLIQNVGMNISDVTEAWQGEDLVAYDPDLNWLVFDVSNYSCDNIATLLSKYDVPIPQMKMTLKVYEVYSENDDKMGIDFQNWKNNEGADLFSAGGRYRNNWAAAYSGGASPLNGSERTSYYNFNPKWNTRYLDFLVSKSRANIVHTGEINIRNSTPASFNRITQIFYMDTSKPVPKAIVPSATNPDYGVGPYQMFSQITGEPLTNDIAIGKGNQQIVEVIDGFGFSMNISDVSINLAEASFNLQLSNSSLIGFTSNGAPRISDNSVVSQFVSIPFSNGGFVIGGLKKQESVKSKEGIPVLMNIPVLGYLFSSESTSTKYSELILVAECEWSSPAHSDVPAQTRKVKRTAPLPKNK